MATWTSDELDRIGGAEELEIMSFRRDGTLRKPVPVWVVRHRNELYVRCGYGSGAAWYLGTRLRREGHISAGGIGRDVLFEDADAGVMDQIDAAYRNKYRSRADAQYVDMVVTAEARSTTIKLTPRPATT